MRVYGVYVRVSVRVCASVCVGHALLHVGVEPAAEGDYTATGA